MMRKLSFVLLLVAAAQLATAQKPLPQNPEIRQKVAVSQLEQALSEAKGKTDAEMAQALSGLELTNRLSSPRLAHLKANLPGQRARQALTILADQAAFLPPPDDEIAPVPAPDVATTRQMLVQIVNYVNNTVRQLPNLMAVRGTTGFEDRPRQDSVDAVGVMSLGYLPIHQVGSSNTAVTYRDRHEVEDTGATKALKQGPPIGGLATTGEFGPILSTALADALKGKVTWARWEQGANGRLAVFHYAVPEDKSSYHVKFCCIVNGYQSDGTADKQVFDERSSYHGDIAFDPADGSILRISLEAEMPPKGLVSNAGIAIEYAPVEIGGRNYICPSKSVSLLRAHTIVPQGAYSRANYQGPAKTYLNEVEFTQYRRFGSETRILADINEPPAK